MQRMVPVRLCCPGLGWLRFRLGTLGSSEWMFPGQVTLLAGGDQSSDHVLQVLYPLAHRISGPIRPLVGSGFDGSLVLAEPAGSLSVPGRTVLARQLPVAFQPVPIRQHQAVYHSFLSGGSQAMGSSVLPTFSRGRGRRKEECGPDAGWSWEVGFQVGRHLASPCRRLAGSTGLRDSRGRVSTVRV